MLLLVHGECSGGVLAGGIQVLDRTGHGLAWVAHGTGVPAWTGVRKPHRMNRVIFVLFFQGFFGPALDAREKCGQIVPVRRENRGDGFRRAGRRRHAAVGE
jgi:hypothetical protein